jgi:hypothetical protein
MVDASRLRAARANVAEILDDHCTITDIDPEAGPWTAEGGLPSATVELYDGPCSLLSPNTRAQVNPGAAPTTVASRILLLPADAPTPTPGARVTVSSTADDYVVHQAERRTHEVLQRVRLTDSKPAEGVPR